MDLSRINPDRLQEYHKEQDEIHEDKMNIEERSRLENVLYDFKYSDNTMSETVLKIDRCLQNRLQEVADKVEELDRQTGDPKLDRGYKTGLIDVLEILNKHLSNE